MSKVLVIGSGGREHAIVWKLKQSKKVDKIYAAPGNGGISELAENIPIAVTDIDNLVTFAKNNLIDLTVVVPDDPLAAGAVDAFKTAGLTAFGPSKAAAQIEASKAFSKELMREQNIPTAEFQTFTDIKKAKAYATEQKLPLVIKASGLALGKGVIICKTKKEVDLALKQLMIEKSFGESGATVVIEEFLDGQEISIHALSDGKQSVIFPPSQDHKQIFDGDNGPNTGGMGAYGPVHWVNKALMDRIDQQVVKPALKGLDKNNAAFAGCLYPGLMINKDSLNVLEFNARFGDPETQIYMRLLDCDLYDLLMDCATDQLKPSNVKWQPGYAVCVVLASGGYPGEYKKGIPISGLEEINSPDVEVFHAGTSKTISGYVTNGGRVLNVTATGKTLEAALKTAYEAVDKISFDGMQYRRDIGRRAAPF